MSKNRYERRALTQNWEDIRLQFIRCKAAASRGTFVMIQLTTSFEQNSIV